MGKHERCGQHIFGAKSVPSLHSKYQQVIEKIGTAEWARTTDLLIHSQLAKKRRAETITAEAELKAEPGNVC
jgi:hypothetical protein